MRMRSSLSLKTRCRLWGFWHTHHPGKRKSTIFSVFFSSKNIVTSSQNRHANESSLITTENVTTFIREHPQALGSDDVKVYTARFMDPECKTCAAFAFFANEGNSRRSLVTGNSRTD